MQEMLFLKEFDKKKNREGNFFRMDIDDYVNTQQTVMEVIVPVCRLMIFCVPSGLYESFYLSFLSFLSMYNSSFGCNESTLNNFEQMTTFVTFSFLHCA